MKASDDLFQLIKSLDQSEKRYFKVFASMHIKKSDNNYVRLFDFIDKQSINQGKYDEEEVKKHFKNEKFIRQLHVSKGYLYNNILKSLRLYNSEKNKVNELYGLLRDIDILFDKSLYSQCKKLLAKAKKIAATYEKHVQMLEIIDMEKVIARVEAYAKRSEEDLDNIYYEVNDATEKIRNVNDYWRLSTKSFFIRKKYGNVRDTTDLKNFNELMKNPLLQSEARATTYMSKNFYYNIKGLYYLTNKDYKNLLKYCKKLVSFLESNPVLMRPDNYLAALNNLLIVQMENKKYNDAIVSINKMRNIETGSGSIKAQIFVRSYDTEINLYLLTGEFEKGVELIGNIEEGLSRYKNKINQEAEILFYYNIAYLYFGLGRYDKVIDWLNKIFNQKELKLREDIQCYARLLNLFVHYELENYDFLEYDIKSTRRFLESHGNLKEFEKTVLNFIRKLINAKDETEKEELCRELKHKVEKKPKDILENKALEYFDFISWLNSKIEKKKFTDILKRKAEQDE